MTVRTRTRPLPCSRRASLYALAGLCVWASGCQREAASEAAQPPLPAPAAPTVAEPAPATSAAAGPALWSRPGYQRPGLIDFHGHLSIFGHDRISAIADQVGIALFINLSGGSGRQGERGWMLAELLTEKLKGRVVNFFNVDWQGMGQPGWARREADRLEHVVRTRGFLGLKISKALGLGVTDQAGRLVTVDDPRLAPLWRKAGELGIPVSIHVADPKAFWAPADANNERWEELRVHPGWSYAGKDVPSWAEMLDASERLFKSYPGTTFVAVHFGNAAEEIDRVDRMLDACPNLLIDVSARVGEFGRHPAQKVRAFFLKHADRILFGTDIGVADDYLMLGSNGEEMPTMADVGPFYEAHFRYFEGDGVQIAHPSPIQGPWKVDAIALPAAVLDKLYRDNALRVLATARKKIAALAPPAAAAEPALAPAAGPVGHPDH